MELFTRFRQLFSRRTYLISRGGEPTVLELDTEAVYRTQPNLRAVIGYIADNVAVLPLKSYIREGDTDRRRDTTSAPYMVLARPNPDQTAYEFIRALVSDILLYDRAMFLVLADDSPGGYQLRLVPPAWVQGYKGTSAFAPEAVTVQVPYGRKVEVPADKFVLMHGYAPGDPMRGVSPIESLKATLTEQLESERYRLQVWKNGGRMSSYIVRPKDVEPWTPEQAKRFKNEFKGAWTGDHASDGGGVPVLEDGMEIKSTQFNAKDAQWVETKQLSRQDVAAVYHIKPGLIWDSGQTYASVKENARALYSEALAPLLRQIEDRLNTFLLPMLGADPRQYVEFDFTAKLMGSFEEQAAYLQSACGAPYMLRNEARARMNLPAIDGGDELVTPLNVTQGGLASPNDTDPTVERYSAEPCAKAAKAPRAVLLKGRSDEDGDKAMEKALAAFFERQGRSVLPKLGGEKAAPDFWNAERWDKELADDIEPLMKAQADAKGEQSAQAIGSEYSAERTRAYIRKMAEKRAEGINAETLRRINAAMAGEVDEESELSTPEGVFENAVEQRSKLSGRAIATAVAGFAVMEAVSQAGASSGCTKTWVVQSANPRPSHAAMDGETVPYSEPFSNGLDWPGAWGFDAADSANCQCAVDINYEMEG